MGKSNKFIATNNGFISDIVVSYDLTGESTTIIAYTDKIMGAKKFSTKQAKAIMLKHKIDGFIYNPYFEVTYKGFIVYENSDGMYTVRRYSSNVSDVDYLKNDCNNPVFGLKYFMFENEAIKHAKVLNELKIDKINKFNNVLDERKYY